MSSDRPIRDFVDVRPHKTVIQLESVRSPDADWISQTYHQTREVRGHLELLAKILARPEGRGLFLLGQYGSGKSHFLAYVVQQIERGLLGPKGLRVQPLTLVPFRSSVALEEVVSTALGIDTTSPDRRSSWSRLDPESRGVVLLIDELSEFLRAKPDERAFSEDVRFLQFMGEWATTHRFFVMASMQEEIERTGKIEYSLFRKLKDRYSTRLELSSTHVLDLLAECFLIKKPGYAEAVGTLARELREAFPRSTVDDAVLTAIYPLHPKTIELLEEVRDRFSKTRGVVDFTVRQLLGDDNRRPFLDRPFGNLLTPDVIVEHFHDVLSHQPDLRIIDDGVFAFYARNMDRLFNTPAQRELAWRLIRLLVLGWLSQNPDRQKGWTVEDAAYALLHRVTRIDPAKNTAVIARILETLARDGRHVKNAGGRFHLDVGDVAAADLDRLLDRELAEIQGAGESLFDGLVALLPDDKASPLHAQRDAWLSKTFRWHHHARPYSLYVGEGDPLATPAAGGVCVCVRLPWGKAGAIDGFVVRPKPIELTRELLELAALVQLSKRPLSPDVRKKVEGRIEQRRGLFISLIRTSFLDAELHDASGARVTLPSSRAENFSVRLEEMLAAIFLRTYPVFPKYAPSYGPLPKGAIGAFLRFAREHELGSTAGDDLVRLVRDGYLEPMGLLKRKAQGYEVPKLDNHELVRRLLPLLPHRPAPKVVFEHMAEPPFGLVHDQIVVLMVFLLATGALEIEKGGRSYRELVDTLPDPSVYDRVVPAEALSLDDQRALELLVRSQGGSLPKEWSVFSERAAIESLAAKAEAESRTLSGLAMRLEKKGTAVELRDKLLKLAERWLSLLGSGDPLVRFRQFLKEGGSARVFIAELEEVRGLPAELDRIFNELDRFEHLGKSPAARVAISKAGPVPPIDRPPEVLAWLMRAKDEYRAYSRNYAEAHDRFWESARDRASSDEEPSPLAKSRLLGLKAELEALADRRARAKRLVCAELSHLEFSPKCACGFDGSTAPIVEELQRILELRAGIDQSVTSFFAKDEVRRAVASLAREDAQLHESTQEYVTGRAELPAAEDLPAIERRLSGVVLVRDVPGAAMIEILDDRAYSREELVRAVASLFERWPGAERLRLKFADAAPRDAIAAWCAEQSLRFGVPLPGGLPESERVVMTSSIRPEWVGPEAIVDLERLGLGQEAEKRILSLLIEARIPAPKRAHARGVSRVALDLVESSRPSSPAELAERISAAYTHTPTLLEVAGPRWLSYLDELAMASFDRPVPSLAEVLRSRLDREWLLVDALGLSLLPAFLGAVAELFPRRKIVDVSFAEIRGSTTTRGAYAQLAAAGIQHAVSKVDAIDRLVHERTLPFADLQKIALAEVGAELRRLTFGSETRLLVFADHGFRMLPKGRGYGHGGDSTIERVVPIIEVSASA
ncbi:MAG: hypothetical protein HY791_18055 [Deltaproteobacteria bacterium]|nr:hypothetical protein [Deltaproteobacteria bacterium]